MENIHSLLTVSISEFKQNPSKVVEEAHGQPVAVLNHNRPAFYTVSPEFMAKMAERVKSNPSAAADTVTKMAVIAQEIEELHAKQD